MVNWERIHFMSMYNQRSLIIGARLPLAGDNTFSNINYAFCKCKFTQDVSFSKMDALCKQEAHGPHRSPE
jgi:hypothetical protein